ncbi:MAG: lactonase family protein [Gammaproteobacteria bacterium]
MKRLKPWSPATPPVNALCPTQDSKRPRTLISRTLRQLACLLVALSPAASHATGVLFTLDNSPKANHVLMFERDQDGELTPAGAFPTEGTGTGTGLGNQGALALSRTSKWLLAVNAGSHDLSVFELKRNGLDLTDKLSSGGLRPVSVTLHQRLVYVLNAGGSAGGTDNITGFSLSRHGKLAPLAGSTRRLSARATGPAQIQFSRDGGTLIVTEKSTNKIDTFLVGDDGLAVGRTTIDSAANTPFGFALGKNDKVFISEANGGAPDGSSVSSYDLNEQGKLKVVSRSVPTTETAACWVVVTRNGRFAYTTNTGSGSISAYAIQRGTGRITLLDADGRTGITGNGTNPIDMALSRGSRFLYSLNSGNGTISAFRVLPSGSLDPITGVSGIPAGANGLAAR